MWVGLFSDIHANREALEACFDHARRAGIGRFIFLGDYVGYGADPGFAVDTIMREVDAGAAALLGNHDDAIASGSIGMNSAAAEALDWTRIQLNSAQREFLTQLPLTLEEGQRLFVHASAHASVESASRNFMATRAQSTFCGHVHVPALFHLSPTEKIAGFEPVQSVEIPLLAPRRWVAVLGSVGQPRDYNPAACYGALDDNETAARKVRDAGLLKILSHRLMDGA
ncbi:MAG: metallophosphoesterase family protein [Pseudolabrys sp.]